MALRILILGSGGREHALAWKLSQSSLVDQIFVCPGNGGTAQEAKTKNVSLDSDDFKELTAFALSEQVLFIILYSYALPKLTSATCRYLWFFLAPSSHWLTV